MESTVETNGVYWQEFETAAIAAGMTEMDLLRFCEPEMLKTLLLVSRGLTKPIIPKIMIDSDVDPKLPYSGYSVLSHLRSGMMEWDPKKFYLYTPKVHGRAYNHISFDGCFAELDQEERTGELKGMIRVNASVLDYFLEHGGIPQEWIDENIRLNFLGTVYDSGNGFRNIRGLDYHDRYH